MHLDGVGIKTLLSNFGEIFDKNTLQMKVINTVFLLLIAGSTFSQNNYCIPQNTQNLPSSGNYIQNFAFADILNRRSGSSLGQFILYPESQFTTNVKLGKTYPITVSHESSAGTTSGFVAWIDYNNDSIFSESEKVFTGTGYYASGMVTIPTDQSYIGKRRMRVKGGWPSVSSPCSLNSYGETEDYLITISATGKDSLYYCVPFEAGSGSSVSINSVVVNTLNNSNSGSNEYNYSVYSENKFTTTLGLGATYTINVHTGQTAGTTSNLCAWIDYNNNQLFEQGEIILPAKSGYSNIATFVVPTDAAILGKHKMRVRASWRTVNDPCGFGSYIETEDYTVSVGSTVTGTDGAKSSQASLSLYPNPTEGKLTIEGLVHSDLLPFRIISPLGETLKSGDISNGHQLDVSELPSGVYTFELKWETGTSVFKFLKR